MLTPTKLSQKALATIKEINDDKYRERYPSDFWEQERDLAAFRKACEEVVEEIRVLAFVGYAIRCLETGQEDELFGPAGQEP